MRDRNVLRSHELGRVSVSVFWMDDECPDYSCLGSFEDRFEASPATLPYDRDTGSVWDGSRWRDSRGRFCEEPEGIDGSGFWRSECRWIVEGGCQVRKGEPNWFRYAYENCRRLDRLDNDWQYVVVGVAVEVNGKELGSAYCGGIEYDYRDDSYLLEMGRELLPEAMEEARGFADVLKEVCA